MTDIRTMIVIVCALLGTFIMVTRASAEDSRVTGYGLFRSTSAEWNWAPVGQSDQLVLERSESGKHVLRFTVPEKSLAGLEPDKARIGIVSGTVGTAPRVWITLDKSYTADMTNSSFPSHIIAQAVLERAVVRQQDSELRVELVFDSLPDLRSAWDLYLLIDSDGNPNNGFQSADYLVQNTALTGDMSSSGLNVAWFEIRPGILKPNEKTEVTACLQNTTDQPVSGPAPRLTIPDGLVIHDRPAEDQINLKPKQAKWFTWKVSATRPGLFLVRLTAEAGEFQARGMQWLSVVSRRDVKREFQTAGGAWLPYPPRPSLQLGNSSPIAEFKSLPSAALKRNLFGITAHLPRSTDDETPFTPLHAVDNDPDTCWASRWWRTSIPFKPEWIEVDLGGVKPVSEIRFLPAWRNSGAPAAFNIQISPDGRSWDRVVEETDYHLQQAPKGDKLRHGNLTWQRFAFEERPVRYVRLEATRLNQGNTGFFCAPMDPFQLRIAELSAFDKEGNEVGRLNRKVQVSSTHTAWYNSPETIKKTWPLMLKSGVKLNRIGQWGDKIDWATVEKSKGTYVIAPEVDHYITESVRNGIDILMTLDYGNNVYQKLKDSPDFGPTWHRGHPFLQCAPTTPEAVQGFANYCAFMADHFRGRVKYFEIWNEENGWFFDAWANNNKVSMVKAYGKALAAAAKAIKQVNPEAVVVFGGTAGSTLDFPRIALEEGAGPYIDVFAFHPYYHPTPESVPANFLTEDGDRMRWKPRPPEITTYEEEIAAFRKLLHRYHPRMQVWADELNWFAPGETPMTQMADHSELTQDKYVARFFAINAWLGCGAIWWSLYNSNWIQEWAVLRSSDLTPRAAYYSAGYVSTVLDDVDGVTDITPEVVGDAPKDLIVKLYRNGRGQLLTGLWRTSFGDDNCEPAPITLRIPGVRAASAEIVDTLYGYTQKATFQPEANATVLPDLLVGDWPLVVRIGTERSE